ARNVGLRQAAVLAHQGKHDPLVVIAHAALVRATVKAAGGQPRQVTMPFCPAFQLPLQQACARFWSGWVVNAGVSIINKSDLIIDRRAGWCFAAPDGGPWEEGGARRIGRATGVGFHGRKFMVTLKHLKIALAGIALSGLLAGAAQAADVVGLITKTEGNPFFVKMREGAQAKAKELGLDLRTFAGKFDGDNDSQVAAIENLISAGAKGFAIVPSDSSAIVPTIKKARDAGLLVIVLDTPLDPIDAADATFATDNFKAGELIGQWAKGTLGDKAKDAKIAFLDLATNQPTVDYLRDQGFMQGFGIDIKDPKHYG